MLKNNLDILRCPLCSNPLCLSEDEKTLRCDARHSYDISKDGYVNLSGASESGDSKEAVDARRSFLDTDFYKPLKDEIYSLVKKYTFGNTETTIGDMGCGDGYYSASLPKIPGVNVFGADLSKFAVRVAAKRTKAYATSYASLYSVSSVFDVPVKDNAFDILLNLFAPCAEEEYKRILKDGGILILVGAGKEHLKELKELIYDEVRLNDERRDLPTSMRLLEKYTLKTKFTPSLEQRDALFTMTPYYYKTALKGKQKLSIAPETEIGAEFDIYIYQNK